MHKRNIHAIGNVGKIIWKDLGGHPYTRLFKGTNEGFARLSSATNPNPDTLRMVPAMAVKFLRDGMDSANIFAQHIAPGGFYQLSLNFFEYDWSNHVPLPLLQDDQSMGALRGASRMRSMSEYAEAVGLSDFASYSADGVKEEEIIFPFKLRFQPTGDVSFPSDTYEETVQEYL